MRYDANTYRVTEKGNFGSIALAVGIVGLVGSAIAWYSEPGRFFHAYLTAFVFWLTLALGGLFFTMLHYLSASRWSVVLRRISEGLAAQLPWMIIAFLPVYIGIHDLYHWSHESAVATDHLLQSKAGYLNVGFFLVRAVIYFAIWSVFALALRKRSLRQDSEPRGDHITGLRRLSAGGMLLFAVTVTFASFDWLMSLQPHWFSTIFGVYVFGGLFLATVSFIALISWFLRGQRVLKETITVEHYHDLGKLMFAFIIFWAYIGFSQYFLIWYGNIPEETFWFLSRWEGGWKPVSLVLVFGHFAAPFVFLIFRNVKRKPILLGIAAIWLLIMHWIDLFWLIYPSHMETYEGLSWIEIAPVVGLGGIFCWLFWRNFSPHALVPVNDHWLKDSVSSISH